MKYLSYICGVDNQQFNYLFTLKQNYYEKMEMHSLRLCS